jgi:hypothetical protein
MACKCFPSFQHLIGKQIDQIQDYILECLHQHIPYIIRFDGTFIVHKAHINLCLGSNLGA